MTVQSAKHVSQRPTVLVTRPAHQAEAFCTLLEQAGFSPLRFPTVHIAALTTAEQLADTLLQLESADIVIFTSVNAVNYAQAAAPLKALLAPATHVLAIGPATARALENVGVDAEVPSLEHSSLGLLALPLLQQVQDNKIALVRGRGGLATLPDGLTAAGAVLEILEVYQRQIPADSAPLQRLFQRDLPHIISATSNETLSNLVTLMSVKERARLWPIPVIVNSERGEEFARSLGFRGDILCACPVGDHGQINTLKAWITQRLTQR